MQYGENTPPPLALSLSLPLCLSTTPKCHSLYLATFDIYKTLTPAEIITHSKQYGFVLLWIDTTLLGFDFERIYEMLAHRKEKRRKQCNDHRFIGEPFTGNSIKQLTVNVLCMEEFKYVINKVARLWQARLKRFSHSSRSHCKCKVNTSQYFATIERSESERRAIHFGAHYIE